MPLVERLIALARQILFRSSLDPAGVGAASGAGDEAARHSFNHVAPPLGELLWGEGRRCVEACGASG